MPKITAFIHSENDAPRIGRLLDSLRPCDEVLIIDNGSQDDTPKIAREHGATVKTAVSGVAPGAYLVDARHDWLLCLRPSEALSEGLEAALFEWKDQDPGESVGFSVAVREESPSGWKRCPPEMRLVNRNRINWTANLPPNEPNAKVLAGDLIRFSTP